MPRKKNTAAQPNSPDQLALLQAQTKTAPCVPAIREAVKAWRQNGYAGSTDTTRLLLNHWFYSDHRLANGNKFEYHYFQREAIETLIYLYEVANLRRQKPIVEKFAGRGDLRLLQYDDFARYAIKMATGSGKTKVMSLAMLWQYFNATAEGRDDYAKTFLLIAPNVIVFERLKTDFQSGRIFKLDPMIPLELKIFWDFQVYVRGEAERGSSQGALYLTNIQQLYERAENQDDDEPDAMTAVLGRKPPANPLQAEDVHTRLVRRREPVLVLNDEAHHTHDEESEWNKGIRRLNAQLSAVNTNGLGLAAQLDFSATPRFTKGSLFTWTVYDYPLKQAMLDGVVKRPIKGVAKGIAEQPSKTTTVRYAPFLVAGVERWREYRQQLKLLKRKPVLFVMMNETSEADDVGDWLRTKYPDEFGDEKLLIIHTNKSGDVSVKDLDKARQAAREVDDDKSPVNCIVSVLMLREGWDVQNVTVVVGLRPYSSKANILPEQTIGRGLRLMFRNNNDYKERVDVIGNKTFIEFVEQLERDEDIQLETFEIGKDALQIITIMPDAKKLDKDMALPSLSPILVRKKSLTEEISGLNPAKFDAPKLTFKQGVVSVQQFKYEGYDLITRAKELERDYTIPEPQTAEEVIGYYARRIAQEIKLPSQFAVLVPKVREFLAQHAFEEDVDLSQPAIVQAIRSNTAHYLTVRAFVNELRKLVVEEQQPSLLDAGRALSATSPFPWSRPTLEATKTVFNLVACDNEFEKAFAAFLQKADDVARFSKLPALFGFTIEYTDAANNLRYYEPDFVAEDAQSVNHLLETKGREDIDVANKDRAAMLWCERATQLTGKNWQYTKVPQKDFEALQPDALADLSVFRLVMG